MSKDSIPISALDRPPEHTETAPPQAVPCYSLPSPSSPVSLVLSSTPGLREDVLCCAVSL